MPDFSQIQLSWDWNDPAVRNYPHLRAKLVFGYIAGIAAIVVLSLFTGDQSMVLPMVVGFTAVFPFSVALSLGSVKRLAASTERPDPSTES